MTAADIKFFFITVNCFLVLYKIINTKIRPKDICFITVISTANSVVSYFLKFYISNIRMIIIFAVLLLYIIIKFKRSLNIALGLSTVSFTVGFLLFSIAWCISIPAYYAMYSLIKDTFTLDIVATTFTGLLQTIICLLFFRIKRLRHGIPQIEKNINSDISTLICVITLFLVFYMYSTDTSNYINLIIAFIIIICSILLIQSYKKHIKNVYIEKVNKRNKEIAEETLSEALAENKKLSDENKKLSAIIHKDNKIVPAMYLAVNEILECESPDIQKGKSIELKNQLQALVSERKEILTDYETKNKALPNCGLPSTNACLKYLYNKATKSNIKFSVSSTAELNKYNGITECENDFNTLLLDLGENAIISADSSDTKNILILINSDITRLSLSIFDSGNQFEPNVIKNLGIKRTTTHKKSGGTGIGLMNSIELCKKHKASFILDETISNDEYSKCVSVDFDGLEQIRIHSNRPETAKIIKSRKDILS